MRTLITTLVVLGFMLIGFALGRDHHTAAPILKLLYFSKLVGERTATHVRGKVQRGLGRLADQQNGVATDLTLSSRGIDQIYLKLRKCLYSQAPCPGFNFGSRKEYQDDVVRHMVDQTRSHLEYLKIRPWDIQPQDQVLAKALLSEAYDSVQLIGLKMIGLFPFDQAHLRLVSAKLSVTSDSEFFHEGVAYLNRYKHYPQVELDAVRIFARQVQYSPDDEIAAVAAAAAFDFMNDSNLRSFRTLRADVKNSPFRFNAIDSSIREFERQLVGYRQ